MINSVYTAWLAREEVPAAAFVTRRAPAKLAVMSSNEE
jgi:hypothetical protein